MNGQLPFYARADVNPPSNSTYCNRPNLVGISQLILRGIPHFTHLCGERLVVVATFFSKMAGFVGVDTYSNLTPGIIG